MANLVEPNWHAALKVRIQTSLKKQYMGDIRKGMAHCRSAKKIQKKPFLFFLSFVYFVLATPLLMSPIYDF
jgi:hypothetical protein